MKKNILKIGLVAIMIIMLLSLFDIINLNRYFLGFLYLTCAAIMLFLLVKK